MLLYHPILLDSPWQAPDDLDQQIVELLKVNEPATVARSEKTDGHTSYDKDNAVKALDVLTTSIKQSLLRIYTMTSHSFHVRIVARAHTESQVRPQSLVHALERRAYRPYH